MKTPKGLENSPPSEILSTGHQAGNDAGDAGEELFVFNNLRVLSAGQASGELLLSSQALSFYGGVDLETGYVAEAGHPLQGECLAHKIVVFPTGKGSTVGSYALYRLAKTGLAPAALIMAKAEPIITTGAILGEIPCVDGFPLEEFESGVAEMKNTSMTGILDNECLRIYPTV